MKIIEAPQKKAAFEINEPKSRPKQSLLGLGLHTSDSDEADPISKVVRLKDHELLAKSPATFCLVNLVRESKAKLNDEWLSSARPGISEKALLLRGFNSVLTSSGISTTNLAYKSFVEAVKRTGPGDAINIEIDPDGISTKYVYSSSSRLALTPVVMSSRQIENAVVLCFPGAITKLSSLHKVFTWCGENEAPVVIAAESFSDDIVKTFEHNAKIGKLKGALLVPNQKDDVSHFSVSDFADLSGAVGWWSEPPNHFLVESCGSIKKCKIGALLEVDCEKEDSARLQKKIDSTLKDLSPEARAIAERRKQMVGGGGRLDIKVPGMSVPGLSHHIDELSTILSLWSAFIREKHVMCPDGLHSYPYDTMKRALQYVSETDDMIKGIGLYIKVKKNVLQKKEPKNK
jgi:hypothetical protein